MQPKKEKEFYTPGEVGELFQVLASTVRIWIKDGRLQAIRLPGNELRIPASEVKRLANNQYGE